MFFMFITMVGIEMKDDKFLKWIHCSLSVLLNLIGTVSDVFG